MSIRAAILAVLFPCLLAPAGAQPVQPGVPELQLGCNQDTLYKRDRDGTLKPHFSESQGVKVVDIDNENVYYTFSAVRSARQAMALKEVEGICFANATRAFKDAWEVYEVGEDYLAAAEELEASLGSAGPAAFWIKQWGLFHAAMARRQLGQADQANDLLTRLLREVPKTVFLGRAKFYLVRCKVELGDLPGAKQMAQEVLKQEKDLSDSDVYDLWFLLGRINVELATATSDNDARRRLFADAVKAFENARNRARGDRTREIKVEVELARVELLQGRVRNARATAERILERSPYIEEKQRDGRARAYLLLGLCDLADSEAPGLSPQDVSKRVSEAGEKFLRVCAVYGDDPEVELEVRGRAFQRALNVFDRLGEREKAAMVRIAASRYGFRVE